MVIHYSRNYLEGDRDQGRFIKWLCLTLACVLMLILSGHLVQFVLAWIATSLCLHRLLLFYPARPGAVLAARKKFVASRIGDLCLIAAALLLRRSCGGLDYATIFAGAAAHPDDLGAPALLLTIAALLKSAQFPLHGWLLEVMETPTPVSALLHAGIINAGGFLILRFADVINTSPVALNVLIAVGGFTALFGSVVMLTQTSIKVSLAWSTIGQMGFMMAQCGLGVYSAALLHLAAHSLYKAHAFLASGGVIDLARASWLPGPRGPGPGGPGPGGPGPGGPGPGGPGPGGPGPGGPGPGGPGPGGQPHPGRISFAVASGGVYHELLREAEDWGADLVVVGSHRPVMSDYLLGSNAKTIVRHAQCSVLVVRN